MNERLLFHVCCAPCFAYLAKEYFKNFEIILFFYNPNIWPKEEYEKRLNEVKRFSQKEKIELIVGEYENEKWFKLVKGHEKDKEGGGRCKICFQMRLEKSAKKAKELNIKNFSTSLAISPYKNLEMIKEIAEKIAQDYNLKFFTFNESEKKILWQKAKDFSKKENFYHQKYCGCLYSLK